MEKRSRRVEKGEEKLLPITMLPTLLKIKDTFFKLHFVIHIWSSIYCKRTFNPFFSTFFSPQDRKMVRGGKELTLAMCKRDWWFGLFCQLKFLFVLFYFNSVITCEKKSESFEFLKLKRVKKFTLENIIQNATLA